MKSIKTKLMKLNFVALFLVLIVITFDSEARIPESNFEYKEIKNLEFYLDFHEYEEVAEYLNFNKPNITVVNSDNKIVAVGSENDEHIKSAVRIADYLTEIDGNKYYRLSYK